MRFLFGLVGIVASTLLGGVAALRLHGAEQVAAGIAAIGIYAAATAALLSERGKP